MAFINIQKARVDRIYEGKGFVAVERFTTSNGENRETSYTVWTDDPNDIPGEGTIVNVSGALSVRIREFDNDQGEKVRFAATNVNRPRITLVDLPSSAPDFARKTEMPTSEWDAAF